MAPGVDGGIDFDLLCAAGVLRDNDTGAAFDKLGDELEAVLLGQHFARCGELGLVRGIKAGREQPAGFVAP